jgi:hypothetical protein
VLKATPAVVSSIFTYVISRISVVFISKKHWREEEFVFCCKSNPREHKEYFKVGDKVQEFAGEKKMFLIADLTCAQL